MLLHIKLTYRLHSNRALILTRSFTFQVLHFPPDVNEADSWSRLAVSVAVIRRRCHSLSSHIKTPLCRLQLLMLHGVAMVAAINPCVKLTTVVQLCVHTRPRRRRRLLSSLEMGIEYNFTLETNRQTRL